MYNGLLVYLGGIAAVVQIFFGFLYYVDLAKPKWSLRKRSALSFLFLAVFVGISGWITRNKTHFDTTVKAATFALRFRPDDEELLRMRARSYKRLGPEYYRDEIADRERVIIRNPDRQENYLPIIEDHILLKEYDIAEAKMRQHASTITDHEIKLMFEFFAVVCKILKGEEYSSVVYNLEKNVSQTPLTKKFIESWNSKYLIDFVNENSFPEPSKRKIKELDDLLRQTAR